MKVKGFVILAAGLTVLLTAASASAHCEIPCGIYDDAARIAMIAEHATTIEKSMTMITELSSESPINYNQLVRWVTNKEQHADEIQHIVTQYFMTQRIKPDTARYAEKLAALHAMLIHAMKCKQTTDLANVAAHRSDLETFEGLYLDR